MTTTQIPATPTLTGTEQAPGAPPSAEPVAGSPGALPVTALRMRGAGDAAVLIPYLVGYHPHNSLVVLCLQGRRVGLTLRLDLPPTTSSAAITSLARAVVAGAQRMAGAEVLVACFTADAALAQRVLRRLGSALRPTGIAVRDALRVADGRWWSLTCHNELCCPSAGTPYDATSSTVAAAATVAGMSALPDKDALRATIAPVQGDQRAAMAAAFTVAQQVVAQSPSCPASTCADWSLVEHALEVTASAGTVPDDVAAELAVRLEELAVRDHAWELMQHGDLDVHVRLWSDLLRRTAAGQVPAVGSLLAFAAWLSGSVGLARVALERVFAAAPEYSMALLVQEALDGCLPPSSWRPDAPGPATGAATTSEAARVRRQGSR